jgi:acetate kinase
MNILVVNSGSSSVKYQIFDFSADVVLTTGRVERIGEANAALHHRWRTPDGALHDLDRTLAIGDHRAAFGAMGAVMRETGVMPGVEGLDAIGHRVVHGGERFQRAMRIDASLMAAIRALAPLAPLHNPANLLGIEICLELFAGVPEVAVFDTAFHQTMPPHAYRYALPESLYTDHGVRRYGFHGSSHAYVARRAAVYLGRAPESLNLITLHLGNGASAAAIEGGRCIDTSMGMTPLEGLVMGTRCGDIDPSLVFYIGRVMNMDAAAVESLLNRASGLDGLCGANDMREVLARAGAGDAAATLALDVYCYRIRKYVGAYAAALQRVDAVVFSGGIGENAAEVRARVCHGLTLLGIGIDPVRNAQARGDVAELQSYDANTRVLMVRTDEEREIAEQTRTTLALEH